MAAERDAAPKRIISARVCAAVASALAAGGLRATTATTTATATSSRFARAAWTPARGRRATMDKFITVTKRPTTSRASAGDDGAERDAKRATTSKDVFYGVDNSLLIHDDARCAPSAKIAGFDLDETVQKTKSGRKAFMAKADDFVLLNAHVTRVMKKLNEDGYKICIFSNQGSVKGALDGAKARDIKLRLANLTRELDVPFQAFCATQSNKPGKENDPHEYRKGGIGMWTRMVRVHNGDVVPDLERCFFVGDAAGRASDHGVGDKEFAEGVGIKFFVPEDIFCEGENW